MVARAMANFGLSQLRLVAPKNGWPKKGVREAASGATHVLDNATVFATVAEAIADLGLEMLEAAAHRTLRNGEPIRLRIGIDSGPVVAGVIGRRKFSYDLWGDTVNTASRMESHGVPGYIQVTERVRGLLADRFVFRERGTVEVKGKGPMRTYLLLGRSPGPSPM